MKIIETYIVWESGIYRKLHYCKNYTDTYQVYYIERDNGIYELTYSEARRLILEATI
jgi:hypothetical protein